MDNRPIGVLDSGMGGLTAVRELLRVMPEEDIVYFGDTGRVPYGTRSPEIVVQYAIQDINFLLRKGVKMVIAACGTVTTTLPQKLTEGFTFPYTGVLIPTVQAAAAATCNGKIGVIATATTIRTGAYERELKKLDPELQVVSRACPLFVPCRLFQQRRQPCRCRSRYRLCRIRRGSLLFAADALNNRCIASLCRRHIVRHEDYCIRSKSKQPSNRRAELRTRACCCCCMRKLCFAPRLRRRQAFLLPQKCADRFFELNPCIQ